MKGVFLSANNPKTSLTAGALKQIAWTGGGARFPCVCLNHTNRSVPRKGKKNNQHKCPPPEEAKAASACQPDERSKCLKAKRSKPVVTLGKITNSGLLCAHLTNL